MPPVFTADAFYSILSSLGLTKGCKGPLKGGRPSRKSSQDLSLKRTHPHSDALTAAPSPRCHPAYYCCSKKYCPVPQAHPISFSISNERQCEEHDILVYDSVVEPCGDDVRPARGRSGALKPLFKLRQTSPRRSNLKPKKAGARGPAKITQRHVRFDTGTRW